MPPAARGFTIKTADMEVIDLGTEFGLEVTGDGGVQVHVTDPEVFEPCATYTAAIGAIWKLWPGQFAWGRPPYEYEPDKLPIDVLAGGDRWRLSIEAGQSPWNMKGEWIAELQAFAEFTAEYRRYE